MRLHVIGSLLAATVLASVPATADVRVSMTDGNVTVSAADITIRQLLTEWARVGQTRIINIERLPATLISLELVNVPEEQALDTMLRSVSGYLAAPRAVAVPNASRYDRIYLLPSSTGTAQRGTTPPTAPATFNPPAPPVFAPPEERTDDDAPRQVPGGGPQQVPQVVQPNGARPAFGAFAPPPPQQRQGPAQTEPPNATGSFGAPAGGAGVSAGGTSAPIGVSTPGMVVPAPAQPNQNPTGGDRR